MAILDRVKANVNICAIFASFSGVAKPSIIAGWQPFYNSSFTDTDFQKVYAAISSIDFSEESSEGLAGTSYTHTVVFRFPKNDARRAERIALLKKIKYLKLRFSNGTDLVVGRNDFNQNALPKISSKTNKQLCEITIVSKSISPAGYTSTGDSYGLPTLIPFGYE